MSDLPKRLPIVRFRRYIHSRSPRGRNGVTRAAKPCSHRPSARQSGMDRFHSGPLLARLQLKEPGLRVHRIQSVMTHEGHLPFSTGRGKSGNVPGFIPVLRLCGAPQEQSAQSPFHDRLLALGRRRQERLDPLERIGHDSLCKCLHFYSPISSLGTSMCRCVRNDNSGSKTGDPQKCQFGDTKPEGQRLGECVIFIRLPILGCDRMGRTCASQSLIG